MKVRIIKEDTKEYFNKKDAIATGVSKEFLEKLEIVRGETDIEGKFKRIEGKAPTNKGEIVEMSSDCFGKAFQERFGDDREYPEVGDTVIFTPNKSYQIDLENEYHIVDDCEIIGFIKAGDKE